MDKTLSTKTYQPAVEDVAYYILSKYDNVTPLKLQKLLYYLKSWGLVAGEKLFNGKFEKWNYGPVNAEVYHKFKEFKSDAIVFAEGAKFKAPFKGQQKLTADFILDCYTQYSAATLSAMSHADLPWKNTKSGKVISDKSLLDYYSSLPFAKNFPLDLENKPFYSVPTDIHYAYIFDMSPEDAGSAQVHPSYKEYKAKREAASKDLQKLLKSFERK